MRERRSGVIATCSRRDSLSPPHSASLEALPPPEAAAPALPPRPLTRILHQADCRRPAYHRCFPVPLCRRHRFYPEDGRQGRKSGRSIYGSAPGGEHPGIFAGSVCHEAGKDRICVLQSGNPEKRSGIAHKRRVAGETDPGSGYVPPYRRDRDGGVFREEIGGATAFL